MNLPQEKSFCDVAISISTFHGRLVLNILNITLAGVATCGNLLIIISVLKSRQLRSQAPVYFILSLATADFLVGMVVQPMLSVMLFSWSPPICKGEDVRISLAFFTCAISIGASMCCCVDKMLKITKPFTYERYVTRGKAMMVTLSIWVSGLLIGYLFTFNSTTKALIIYGALMEMSLAIMVGVYCSVKIYGIASQQIQKIHNNGGMEEKRKLLLERRLAVSLIAILAAILICWMPYILFRTCSLQLYNESNWELFYTIKTWLGLLGYANSSVNLFIFGFKNREIKKAIRNFLNIRPKDIEGTSTNNIIGYGPPKKKQSDDSRSVNTRFNKNSEKSATLDK